MSDQISTGNPIHDSILEKVRALNNRSVEFYVLEVTGFDPKLSSDANAAYRSGMRIGIANIAADLEAKRFAINRPLYEQLIKAIDGVYHDFEFINKGTQLNIRFDWQTEGSYPDTVKSVYRKKIKNVLSVRIAFFQRGEHTHDVSGIFARTQTK